VVEIADQDGQRALIPARALGFSRDQLLEASAVVQARQRVGARGVGQAAHEVGQPVLELMDEHRGHGERADGLEPARHEDGRRRRQAEDDGVRQGDERDLEDRLDP